jgi:hypothetical protein
MTEVRRGALQPKLDAEIEKMKQSIRNDPRSPNYGR